MHHLPSVMSKAQGVSDGDSEEALDGCVGSGFTYHVKKLDMILGK